MRTQTTETGVYPHNAFTFESSCGCCRRQDRKTHNEAGSKNKVGKGRGKEEPLGNSMKGQVDSRQDSKASRVGIQQTKSFQRGKSNAQLQSHRRDCIRYIYLLVASNFGLPFPIHISIDGRPSKVLRKGWRDHYAFLWIRHTSKDSFVKQSAPQFQRLRAFVAVLFQHPGSSLKFVRLYSWRLQGISRVSHPGKFEEDVSARMLSCIRCKRNAQ